MTSALAVPLAVLAPCAIASATSLTGLAAFSTCDDASLCAAGVFGHRDSSASGSLWDTVGGNQSYNLYVASGSASSIVSASQFLNSGNDLSTTAIDLSLSTGTHVFTIVGDNHPGYSPALSLFFNGHGGTPGISVFAPLRTGLAEPPIAADCAASTPGLASHLVLVPGACTLSFFDGTNTVTLADYFWERTDSLGHSVDLVGPISTIANGAADFVGQFTLTITPGATITSVPEPLPLLLLGGSLIGLLTVMRSARLLRSLPRTFESGHWG